MSKQQSFNSNPAVASISDMVKLRYGAKELTAFPRIVARQMLAGGHRSRFRGRGMDFDEVRIYQPGDDVRSIDWRVTARTQEPHTKVFREERERPVLVICDLRSTMFFGSQQLKSVTACEVSAALAWAGLNANDRVGALIFGQQQQAEIKPRRSHHTVLEFIHQLEDYSADLLTPKPDQYSLADMLEESRRFALPGTTVFVVSDFHDLTEECNRHLFELSRHCNLNFCHIYDDIETHLPPPGLYAVSDGQKQTMLDASNQKLRSQFEQGFLENQRLLKKLSEQLSAGLLSFVSNANVMSILSQVFGRKRRRKRAFAGK